LPKVRASPLNAQSTWEDAVVLEPRGECALNNAPDGLEMIHHLFAGVPKAVLSDFSANSGRLMPARSQVRTSFLIEQGPPAAWLEAVQEKDASTSSPPPTGR